MTDYHKQNLERTEADTKELAAKAEFALAETNRLNAERDARTWIGPAVQEAIGNVLKVVGPSIVAHIAWAIVVVKVARIALVECPGWVD